LEGKIPLGTRRRKWEDNTKTDLKTQDDRMWTRFNWMRTGSSGRLL